MVLHAPREGRKLPKTAVLEGFFYLHPESGITYHKTLQNHKCKTGRKLLSVSEMSRNFVRSKQRTVRVAIYNAFLSLSK